MILNPSEAPIKVITAVMFANVKKALPKEHRKGNKAHGAPRKIICLRGRNLLFALFARFHFLPVNIDFRLQEDCRYILGVVYRKK